MGCSASSSAVLSQSDVTSKKDSLPAMDAHKKDKNKLRSNRVSVYSNKGRPADSQSFGTGIRISTKTPKEPVPPEKTQKDGASSAKKQQYIGKLPKENKSPYSQDLTKEMMPKRNTTAAATKGPEPPKRSSVIARKLESDRVISEAATDIHISTKTPKEILPPLKQSKSPTPSRKSLETVENKNGETQNSSPLKGRNSKSKENATCITPDIEKDPSQGKAHKKESSASLPPNIEDNSKTSATKTMASLTDNDTGSKNSVKDAKNSDNDNKKEGADIDKVMPKKMSDDAISSENLLKCDEQAQNVGTSLPQIKLQSASVDKPRPRSAGNHSHHNHHHHHHHPHHHHHHRHHVRHGHSAAAGKAGGSPEKGIKITSKDAKTHFVFKTVKSHDEPEGDPDNTKDILIQTDVISVNDNNEKTKKKLLIKMRKLGSK